MVRRFPRGGCAENGLDPKAIYDFVERAEREDLGIDSFMILKGGVVVAEGYHAPYTNETPHVEFSLSKSIVATALGFAVYEGKISLDDPVTKFFPEYGKRAGNERITVRHLVTMTAGKMVGMAAARHKRDWIKLFFDTPPLAPPGKLFLYVNDNFYLLSALISRVYRQSLVDFLFPRLFEPLGIEKPFWEVDSFGHAAGGWGLYLPIEDLAKIVVCYSDYGSWKGKQVIPAEWVREATSYQVPTVKKGQIDVTKGYGYGFWRTSMPNAYRAYGLYGQFGYVFEDNDTVLVFNSGIARDMRLAAAINDMCKKLWNTPDESYEQPLRELTASLGDKDDLRSVGRNRYLEEKYNGKALFTKSGTFASMLCATMSTVFDEHIGHLDLFRLTRKENGELFLLWREGEFVNEVAVGMDNKYAVSDVSYGQLKLHACVKGAWIDRRTLRIVVRFNEACMMRRLDFDFRDEKHVKVRNESFPDLGNLAAYYVDFSGFPLPKPLDGLLVKGIVPAILTFGEPTFRMKETPVAVGYYDSFRGRKE